jgi:hypothetical protein
MARRRTALALCALLCASAPMATQTGGPVTASALRRLARDAAAAADADRTEIVLTFDREVRARWGDFESFPISIIKNEALNVYLTAPLMRFRTALIEHLRMREPIADVPFAAEVTVVVAPERLTAPDILAIAVERAGKPVPPVRNALKPMTFTSGSGESALLHAGEVHFPLDAFRPGQTVAVVARPKDAEPVTVPLSDMQLRTLK